MRIGLLGGTFDPIHYGHLWIAEYAREKLQLEQVWFLPAAQPPHKVCGTPAQHRVAMVRLALQQAPGTLLCDLELQRPGPSYTVDTLQELRQLHPAHSFVLLLGMDMAIDLPTWNGSETILAHTEVVALARPGHVGEILWPGTVLCPELGFQVSATHLRERLACGRSVRYLIPEAVLAYIHKEGLYKFGKGRAS